MIEKKSDRDEKGQVTLECLASELGTSISTVSRALSGKGRVSRSTRRKIQEYAASRGYPVYHHDVPVTAKTGNIGVILPKDAYTGKSFFFQECLLGICQTANLMGYDILVAMDTGESVSSVENWAQNRKVDGVILLRNVEHDRMLPWLIENQIPVALTGNYEDEHVIRVDVDNRGAAEAMTTHLLASGYSNIYMLVDDMHHVVDELRCQGFLDALRRRGVEDGRHRILNTPSEQLPDMLDTLVDHLFNLKADCILCSDDVLCTSVFSRLQAEHVRIPLDIGVASLFNSPSLDCFSPSVTTVSISAMKMGNAVCKQMVHYLEGKPYEQSSLLDYELLIRKSTKLKV